MTLHVRWRRLFTVIIRVFAALGLLVFTVSVTPLDYWWASKLAGPWDDPKGDVLIVLGGSTREYGLLGGSSYLRTGYAILAYREGGFRSIVLTGGGSPVPVARDMKNYMVREGIPPAIILTETASHSTRQNALFSKPLLEDIRGRKVLLTSDFHMFRAHRVFRKLGLEVSPRPVPDVRKRASDWKGRWPAFLDLVQESVKIGYYFVRGWI